MGPLLAAQAVPCLIIAGIAHPRTHHPLPLRVPSLVLAFPLPVSPFSTIQRPALIQTKWRAAAVHSNTNGLQGMSPVQPSSVLRPQILWALCVYVEAVSVLPQLRMMQKAKVRELVLCSAPKQWVLPGPLVLLPCCALQSPADIISRMLAMAGICCGTPGNPWRPACKLQIQYSRQHVGRGGVALLVSRWPLHALPY